jgi:hypothetical protein
LRTEKIPLALTVKLKKLTCHVAFLACQRLGEFLQLQLGQVEAHPCHLADLPLLPAVALNVTDPDAVVAAKKSVKTGY